MPSSFGPRDSHPHSPELVSARRFRRPAFGATTPLARLRPASSSRGEVATFPGRKTGASPWPTTMRPDTCSPPPGTRGRDPRRLPQVRRAPDTVSAHRLGLFRRHPRTRPSQARPLGGRRAPPEIEWVLRGLRRACQDRARDQMALGVRARTLFGGPMCAPPAGARFPERNRFSGRTPERLTLTRRRQLESSAGWQDRRAAPHRRRDPHPRRRFQRCRRL